MPINVPVQQVQELLSALPNISVLCTGDMMLDRYIYGVAERISPEAPIPIVRIKKRVAMPGGAGNVCNNLAALGVLALSVSVTGDDPFADMLTQIFSAHGLIPPIFIRDTTRNTTVKTRLIAEGQQVVRFDEETVAALNNDIQCLYINSIERYMTKVNALSLSDYGKGCLCAEVTQKIIHMAKLGNIAVVVDPKGKCYEKYRGATLLTPNLPELCLAVGRNVECMDDIAEAAHELIQKFGIHNVLVTLSENGMLLVHGEGDRTEHVFLPSLAKEVFDVSGAGDTVVAVMAATLAASAPMETGACLAALAAGVVVGKLGTATASPSEIKAALNTHTK